MARGASRTETMPAFDSGARNHQRAPASKAAGPAAGHRFGGHLFHRKQREGCISAASASLCGGQDKAQWIVTPLPESHQPGLAEREHVALHRVIDGHMRSGLKRGGGSHIEHAAPPAFHHAREEEPRQVGQSGYVQLKASATGVRVAARRTALAAPNPALSPARRLSTPTVCTWFST